MSIRLKIFEVCHSFFFCFSSFLFVALSFPFLLLTHLPICLICCYPVFSPKFPNCQLFRIVFYFSVRLFKQIEYSGRVTTRLIHKNYSVCQSQHKWWHNTTHSLAAICAHTYILCAMVWKRVICMNFRRFDGRVYNNCVANQKVICGHLQ